MYLADHAYKQRQFELTSQGGEPGPLWLRTPWFNSIFLLTHSNFRVFPRRRRGKTFNQRFLKCCRLEQGQSPCFYPLLTLTGFEHRYSPTNVLWWWEYSFIHTCEPVSLTGHQRPNHATHYALTWRLHQYILCLDDLIHIWSKIYKIETHHIEAP